MSITNIFSLDNQIQINVLLIQNEFFGLEGAVYIAEVIQQYHEYEKTALVTDGYFLVNRNQICQRTTIQKVNQRNIDKKLTAINIVNIDSENEDVIKLNFENLLALISGTDKLILKKAEDACKLYSTEIKNAKKCNHLQELKNLVTESNEELREILYSWIEARVAARSKYSAESVKLFLSTLYNFCKDDKQKAIEIVNIAIANDYRDCNWAITKYKSSKQYNKNLNIREISVPEVMTADEFNRGVKF